MPKEVLLVLGILQGQYWNPVEGHKTIVEAQLDNHKLSTESIALTSSPKFQTEITWQSDKEVIRRYKINRVPIKIECFSFINEKERHFLGYVIVPLSTAVENIQADCKWYKLLGGSSKICKNQPSILLRLHLESMNSKQESQINGTRQIIAKKPVSNVQINQNKTNGHSQNLNLQRNSPLNQSPRPIVQAPVRANNVSETQTNGIDLEDMSDMSDVDPSDISEISDSSDNDSMGMIVEAYSLSGNQSDGWAQQNNEVKSQSEGRLPQQNEIVTNDVQRRSDLSSNRDQSKSGLQPETQSKTKLQTNIQSAKNYPSERFNHQLNTKPKVIHNVDKARRVNDDVSDVQGAKKKSASSDVRDNSKNEETGNSGNSGTSYRSDSDLDSFIEEKMKLKKGLKEDCKLISQSFKDSKKSGNEFLKPNKASGNEFLKPNKAEFISSISTEKRLGDPFSKRLGDPFSIFADHIPGSRSKALEVSDNFDDKLEEKLKKRSSPFSYFGEKVEKKVTEKKKLNRSLNTSAAQLIAESISLDKNEKLSMISLNIQSLSPVLDRSGKFFYIGSRNEVNNQEFNFTVTLFYARNISQAIDTDLIPSLKGDYRFMYHLFKTPIHTDVFSDLDNPEFMAEKSTTKIISTTESIARYFGNNFILSIYFLSGEKKIAVSNVDLSQLVEIAGDNYVKIEGVYEISPIKEYSPSYSTNLDSKKKPMIAISAELSKSSLSDSLSRQFQFGEKSKIGSRTRGKSSRGESYLDPSRPQSVHYDSKNLVERALMGESSDDEASEARQYRFKRKRDTRSYGDSRTANLKSDFETRKEKEFMLHQAAYEVEMWKDDKKKLFIKKCEEKEENLQRLIASEWKLKIAQIELQVNAKISSCEQLETKLNYALADVNKKEDILKNREISLSRREKQLEKDRLEKSKNLKETNFERHLHKKVTELESEVSRLNKINCENEKALQSQQKSMIELQKRLVQSNNPTSDDHDKDDYEKRLENVSERKHYYKTQYFKALNDLHKYHALYRNRMDQITSSPSGPTRTNSAINAQGEQLRKLKNERQALLQSGLYDIEHALIKSIDGKIKKLVQD